MLSLPKIRNCNTTSNIRCAADADISSCKRCPRHRGSNSNNSMGAATTASATSADEVCFTIDQHRLNSLVIASARRGQSGNGMPGRLSLAVSASRRLHLLPSVIHSLPVTSFPERWKDGKSSESMSARRDGSDLPWHS